MIVDRAAACGFDEPPTIKILNGSRASTSLRNLTWDSASKTHEAKINQERAELSPATGG